MPTPETKEAARQRPFSSAIDGAAYFLISGAVSDNSSGFAVSGFAASAFVGAGVADAAGFVEVAGFTVVADVGVAGVAAGFGAAGASDFFGSTTMADALVGVVAVLP